MSRKALDPRICLSIGEPALDEAWLSNVCKTDLLEIRGDLCRLKDEVLEALVREHPNMIFTYRSGASDSDVALRQMLLAVRCGAKYIDIDACAPAGQPEAVKDAITKCDCRTKLIISRHFFDSMPSYEALEAAFSECSSLGADLVKIAALAHDTAEAARILRLYTPERNGRLLAFAMGDAGQFTRSVMLDPGAPFTYCSLGEATAPGQYTASQMEALLDAGNYPFSVPNACECALIREMHENRVARRSVPCSKSIAQRTIIAAAIARGRSVLKGFTPCDDTQAAIDFATGCGCRVFDNAGHLEITSPGIDEWNLNTTVECGESGLLARLLMPLLAYRSSRDGQTYTLQGTGTLNGRDMKETFDNLRAAGVECTPQNRNGGEFLPVSIRAGKGFGNKTELTLSGRDSSQIVSGFLMLLPLLNEDTHLIVQEPASTPYIWLTVDTLQSFGIRVKTDKNVSETCRNVSFTIPSGQSYAAVETEIESDWSSAAFLKAAAILASRNGGPAEGAELILEGIKTGTSQADEALLQLSGELKPFIFDATDCPDLFPALTALAVFCPGESRIKGVRRLAHKESNRAESIISEWSRLGFRLYIEDDTLVIAGDPGAFDGHRYDRPILCSSHNDHRIAMALIITAMFTGQDIRLDDISCISKSFPNFVSTLGIQPQQK